MVSFSFRRDAACLIAGVSAERLCKAFTRLLPPDERAGGRGVTTSPFGILIRLRHQGIAAA
jgi:hypothetical protein